MLVMSLGILDIQYPSLQIHIFPEEQPGFICTDPTAVKKPEKHRDRHFSYNGFFPTVDDRYAVTFMEKPDKFYLIRSIASFSILYLSPDIPDWQQPA